MLLIGSNHNFKSKQNGKIQIVLACRNENVLESPCSIDFGSEMYDSLLGFEEIRKECVLDIENGSNGLFWHTMELILRIMILVAIHNL